MGAVALGAVGCKPAAPTASIETVETFIYPDYGKDLVLPCNIAPLNFYIRDNGIRRHHVRIDVCDSTGASVDFLTLKTRGKVQFPLRTWRKLTSQAVANHGALKIHIDTFAPFSWKISPDSIDPYVIYRSGPFDDNPGGRLQVYQRSLQDFEHKLLIDNALTDNNCMNCHAVGAGNAGRMIVHIRGAHAGTLVIHADTVRKLIIPATYDFRLSYPSHNPVYPYIAFATTKIAPFYYVNSHRTQDLIADYGGRIVLYDIRRDRIFTSPALSDTAFQYTFPAWSADGRTLYFCRTATLPLDSLTPDTEKEALIAFRYDLYKCDFDPVTDSFGEAELVSAVSRSEVSAAMPAVHPEGRYILVSAMMMGSHASQNQGDIYLIDTEKDTLRAVSELNSPDGEAAAGWSVDGKWVVYRSKMQNGSNSALYIAHFECDSAEGQPAAARFSTPFVIPERNPYYYKGNMRMQIFPVFSRTPSPLNPQKWRQWSRQDAHIPDLSAFTPTSTTESRPSGH
ncbi:MAG: hypothetical protein K2H68_02375 [Bacteroidales bacterium]|nr:hypothetical protein [Bacteroidales bacterium]